MRPNSPSNWDRNTSARSAAAGILAPDLDAVKSRIVGAAARIVSRKGTRSNAWLSAFAAFLAGKQRKTASCDAETIAKRLASALPFAPLPQEEAVRNYIRVRGYIKGMHWLAGYEKGAMLPLYFETATIFASPHPMGSRAA